MNNLKYSNSNKNIKSVEQYKMILRKIKKKNTHETNDGEWIVYIIIWW